VFARKRLPNPPKRWSRRYNDGRWDLTTTRWCCIETSPTDGSRRSRQFPDATRSCRLGNDALVELAAVFRLISEEYAARDETLPSDTTEIVHA
jgi:hypothetical protein